MNDKPSSTPAEAAPPAAVPEPAPPAAVPEPAPPAAPAPPVSRWRWTGNLLVRLAVILVAGALVGLFVTRWDEWVGTTARQATDDAYVRGDITPLSAQVEGYLRAVPATDFQLVKAGDLLIEIEDQDYLARVAQAEADLAGAEAAVANLKSRKDLQHAQIAEAEDVISGAYQTATVRTDTKTL